MHVWKEGSYLFFSFSYFNPFSCHFFLLFSSSFGFHASSEVIASEKQIFPPSSKITEIQKINERPLATRHFSRGPERRGLERLAPSSRSSCPRARCVSVFSLFSPSKLPCAWIHGHSYTEMCSWITEKRLSDASLGSFSA